MKKDDAVLIQRTLAGDDNAFSELVMKYQKQVHALAWRQVGDFHTAEDITQDTFLKAYERLHTLKEPHRFAGWLYVIANRRCLAWFRKRRLHKQVLEKVDTPVTNKDAYSQHIAAEQSRNADTEQQEVVKKLLSELKESDRTVITLHYFAEMTCEQMSEFLGVSANTVKSRLRRARNRLKQEEPMIREAISNFQFSPHLAADIMQEITKLKPATPSASKPFVPWIIGAASTVLIVLMLGLGSKDLGYFQLPYSLDAQSETTVELVDVSIVQNVDAQQDVRNQFGERSDRNGIDDGKNANQVGADQGDSTQWNLPIGAKTRLSKGSINGISSSPDGTQIAIASPTGVWIYDANTGAELTLLTDHTTDTGKVAYSPDGNTLASGMYGNISLWDIATKKLFKSFKIKETSVDALQFIDDGKTLLCEFYDGSVSLCDITTGEIKDFVSISSQGFSEQLKDIFGHGTTTTELYLNPDNDNGIFAVGYENGKIRLEETATGRHIKTLQGHDESILYLVFSPDGTLLVSADDTGAPIRLWDVTTGQLLKSLTQKPKLWGNHTFSNDGKILACQTRDNEIELWDVATQTFCTKIGEKLDFGESHFAFSRDSQRIVIANREGEIQVWDVNTGEKLSTFSTGHTQGLLSLEFSPDSSMLACAYPGTINLWDTQNFTHKPIHIQPNTWLMNLVFSSDNKTIICAERFMFQYERRDAFVKESVFGTLSLWDIQTGNKVSDLPVEWHKGELPIPRGKWRTSRSTSGIDNMYRNVVFSPDGFRIVAALNTNDATKESRFTIFVWEIWEDPNRRTYKTLKGHTDTIHTLAFSVDGKTIASGSNDGTIRLWDSSTGTQLLTLPSEKTNKIAFSMDGKTLASISDYSKIILWDIATEKQLITLNGLNENVSELAFSPDNKILASSNRDGTIRLWNFSTGTQLTTFKGYVDQVNMLSFSSDGKTLASGSRNGAIFIWDVPYK